MKVKSQNLVSIFSVFCVGLFSCFIWSIIYFYNGLFNTFFVLPAFCLLVSLIFLGLAVAVKSLFKKRLTRIKNTKKIFSYSFFLGLIFYFFSPFFGLVSKYPDYETHQLFFGPNITVSIISYFLIIFSALNFLSKKQNEN